jgi:hypothetical protein
MKPQYVSRDDVPENISAELKELFMKRPKWKENQKT